MERNQNILGEKYHAPATNTFAARVKERALVQRAQHSHRGHIPHHLSRGPQPPRPHRHHPTVGSRMRPPGTAHVEPTARPPGPATEQPAWPTPRRGGRSGQSRAYGRRDDASSPRSTAESHPHVPRGRALDQLSLAGRGKNLASGPELADPSRRFAWNWCAIRHLSVRTLSVTRNAVHVLLRFLFLLPM
jgi:hypothetical protein